MELPAEMAGTHLAIRGLSENSRGEKIMNGQALRMAVAGGLLISGVLAAEPLKDLQDRLTAVRSQEPIRVAVEVEILHRGKAPLHLSDAKLRGRVIVDADPRGVHLWAQKFSSWGSQEDIPGQLLAEEDARALVDPAGWLGSFLTESTLVEDKDSIWEGKPARLLVVHPPDLPAELEVGKTSKEGEPLPVVYETKIWLGADGLPLALERTALLRLPGLETTQHQNLTFQQSGGRLLVAQSTETFSGNALAGMRGSDTKTMKVAVE
jgi:hypothetical protein